MRRLSAVAGGLIVFLAGYASCSFLGQQPEQVRASQEDQNPQLSKDILESYRKSNKAIRELNNLFVAGGQSTAAFSGINYFAASVGGVDADMAAAGRAAVRDAQRQAGIGVRCQQGPLAIARDQG